MGHFSWEPVQKPVESPGKEKEPAVSDDGQDYCRSPGGLHHRSTLALDLSAFFHLTMEQG
jgi:hypothetical protein